MHFELRRRYLLDAFRAETHERIRLAVIYDETEVADWPLPIGTGLEHIAGRLAQKVGRAYSLSLIRDHAAGMLSPQHQCRGAAARSGLVKTSPLETGRAVPAAREIIGQRGGRIGTTPRVEVLVLPKPVEKDILNLEGAAIGG